MKFYALFNRHNDPESAIGDECIAWGKGLEAFIMNVRWKWRQLYGKTLRLTIGKKEFIVDFDPKKSDLVDTIREIANTIN